MIVQQEALAKKYAEAILNLYFDSLNEECIENFATLERFIRCNKKFLAYLSVAAIDIKEREKMLVEMVERISSRLSIFCYTIKRIVLVLLKHKRIELLGDVIRQIIKQFRIRKKILPCKIETSHEISKANERQLVSFFDKITKRDLCIEFEVNKSLICGVRVKSDFFLWESSIDKTLKRIKVNALRQAGLL
jgi:ATP synthase F1 delta subunit